MSSPVKDVDSDMFVRQVGEMGQFAWSSGVSPSVAAVFNDKFWFWFVRITHFNFIYFIQ